MPSPNPKESREKFIPRCMSSEEAKKSFPDQEQRTAFCFSQWKNKGKSSAAVFVYRDTKTGELYRYSRRGFYKKDGRTLIFVRKSTGEDMKNEHILNKAAKIYADEKARYPPNCNEGYVEKDGKCVPKDKTEE